MSGTVTEARLFVATGVPVQPHSSLGLSGLAVEYRWIRIPVRIFQHVGLPAGIEGLHRFCEHFSLDNPTEDTRPFVCECDHTFAVSCC